MFTVDNSLSVTVLIQWSLTPLSIRLQFLGTSDPFLAWKVEIHASWALTPDFWLADSFCSCLHFSHGKDFSEALESVLAFESFWRSLSQSAQNISQISDVKKLAASFSPFCLAFLEVSHLLLINPVILSFIRHWSSSEWFLLCPIIHAYQQWMNVLWTRRTKNHCNT